MALPDGVLSTATIPAQFRFPRNIPKRPLIAYEYGGIALSDPSQGLRRLVWLGEWLEGTIYLSAEGVEPVAFLSVGEIQDFDFTFDQNMRPCVAYQLPTGVSRFYWYDGTVSGYVTLELPAGSNTPKCAIDDNRDMQVPISDIILAYVRDGTLYYRQQRDRFEDEYTLAEDVGVGLIQIGMNRVWRFQFMLSTAAATFEPED